MLKFSLLSKIMKRAIWQTLRQHLQIQRNSAAKTSPPLQKKNKKNRADPRRKSNKVGTRIHIQFHCSRNSDFLANSCRFAVRLSFIEFSPWSGVYSGSRAPPRCPFFRENRAVLPVKCIKWFKHKFGIIHIKSRGEAARPSLFQFSPQSGDFFPLSGLGANRLEIWFRMRSEHTLSTNRPTGSVLVAMGS